MDQVAALAENAMLHKEMARHFTRVFTWQICLPAMLGTLIAETWPVFPRLHAAVHEAAALVSCARIQDGMILSWHWAAIDGRSAPLPCWAPSSLTPGLCFPTFTPLSGKQLPWCRVLDPT